MRTKKVKKERVKKKMSSRAKKVLILGCFCALLMVTGIVNIYINNNVANEANATIQSSGNFFTNYKTDRVDTRNQEILYWGVLISFS